MLIHFKNEKFDDLIKEGKVVVDFYADWCGPCKMLAPIIETLAQENEKITFVKVNVDEQEELVQSYGVMSIPTILLFKEGNLEKKQIGFMPKEVLEEWIK